VDGIVGSVRCKDKELGIESLICSVNDVVDTERIHVMDDRSAVDLSIGHSEIASLISHGDMVT
jgi:hypothetical protein